MMFVVKGRNQVRNVVLSAGVLAALACGGGGGGGGFGGQSYSVQTLFQSSDFISQIRFAPDGRLFFTELATGRIRIFENGTLLAQEFATVPIATAGEQGLLGLTFDPDFANNGFVYVFHTTTGPLRQRIVRFTDVNNIGTNPTVIVDNLPAGTNHCAGRIGFGMDGKLYATVGDVGDPANSQNDNTPAGKLLRYNSDGTIPLDNPIVGNPMYAKGLRNSFGLTFHPTSGTPYASENGPTCDDELNRFVIGGNYGWRPGIPCGDNDPNFIQAIRTFNPVIAPTGIAFYTGSDIPEFTGDLFMGSFNDGALRRFRIDDTTGNVLQEERIVTGRSGGVIDVTTGTNGRLYFSDGTGVYSVMKD